VEVQMFQAHIASILHMDAATLDEEKLKTDIMMAKCSELVGGLKQAANMLSRFVSGYRSQVARDALKAKSDAEKFELQKTKLEGKTRADALRRSVVGAASLSPLIAVDVDVLEKVPVHDSDVATDAFDFDKPWLLKESAHIRDWGADKVVQQVTSQFAAKYKKQPELLQQHKYQVPFKQKAGQEQTEKLFASLMAKHDNKIMDITPIAATWKTTSWMFGLQSDAEICAPNPNSSAMVRCLQWGTVETFMMQASEVAKVYIGEAANLNMDHACNLFRSISKDIIAAKTLKVYHIIQHKDTALYIPQGWLALDRHGSSPLIYGARKSFLLSSSTARAEYTLCKNFLANEHKNVDRMDAIQKMM
jgi:hypothetical protein